MTEEIKKNYNIGQITDVDIKDNTDTFILNDIEYVEVLGGLEIIKLGYCCETRGNVYPIYLTIDGQPVEINISSSGMYEFQPELWTDINDTSDQNQYTTNIVVTSVKLPKGIRFTLDYVLKN